MDGRRVAWFRWLGHRSVPLFLSFLLSVVAGEVQAEYTWTSALEEGAVAPADLIAPAALVIFNPEKTAWRQDLERHRTPLLFRFNADADLEVEAELRLALARARRDFLARMEEVYHRKVLADGMMEGPRFERMVAGFRKQVPNFPLTLDLARLWAAGQSDEAIQAEWLNLLRSAQQGWIRADALPVDLGWTGMQGRLLTLARSRPTPALGEALKSGRMVARTNIVTLSRARRDFRAGFSDETKGLGRFLAGFIKVNCLLEEDLSRAARVERARTVWESDRYELGEMLVRRGQVVDATVARALREWTESRVAALSVRRAERERIQIANEAAALVYQAAAQAEAAREAQRRSWMVGAGVALFLGILGFASATWMRRRRDASHSLALGKANRDTIRIMTCPSCADLVQVPDEVAMWRERAAHAERRAQTAFGLIRGQLLPALAAWVKSRAVRALAGQRDQMREDQRLAEAEIRQLTQRLEEAHAPLQDRLRAYEGRIAELERELAARGEENKALLRAQLEALRKQIQREQGSSSTQWN